MPRSICLIPARMAASRFPGKPLAPMLGLPLVLHVLDRCRLATAVDAAVVATCDEDIRQAVIAHGGTAVMTADTHPGCVDRVDEAAALMGLADDDLVILVQGDEVMVTPDMVDAMIDAHAQSGAAVVNLASRIRSLADHDDPNVVKVSVDLAGNALYFSRSPIPSRVRTAAVPMWQQTGVMALSVGFLRTFGRLERTPLEMAEGIDMMRCLEHGYRVRMVLTEAETIGVDTPADLSRGEDMLRADPVTARYLGGA